MRLKLLVLSVLTIAFCLLGGAAHAQPGGPCWVFDDLNGEEPPPSTCYTAWQAVCAPLEKLGGCTD